MGIMKKIWVVITIVIIMKMMMNIMNVEKDGS